MNNPYYQEGNTIKLKARFGDFEEEILAYPDEVHLKIYNSEWDIIKDYLVTDQEDGGFYIQYHVFDEVGTFYYEWLGLFNGMPSLERKKIVIKKV